MKADSCYERWIKFYVLTNGLSLMFYGVVRSPRPKKTGWAWDCSQVLNFGKDLNLVGLIMCVLLFISI